MLYSKSPLYTLYMRLHNHLLFYYTRYTYLDKIILQIVIAPYHELLLFSVQKKLFFSLRGISDVNFRFIGKALKASQFQTWHKILTSMYFPPKFEFINSYSAWKRLLKWLLLNSKRFSNPHRYYLKAFWWQKPWEKRILKFKFWQEIHWCQDFMSVLKLNCL